VGDERDEAPDRQPETTPTELDDRAVYVISVAAELAGVHPQTLRIYERKGLVQPKRTPGNSRRYSARDVARLRMIQRLTQEEGMNLAGVRMMLEMENELARMRRRAERLAAELDRQRRQAQHELEQLQRRNPPSDIVPLSATRRVRLRVTERARTRAHALPIALGPGGAAANTGSGDQADHREEE
jgi:MerR family transcriptional regulator, heat shock protein HspR